MFQKLQFHAKAAESPGYRPDIDGLRAVAVLSVVLYHAGYASFSGGFVGVDIFFVISGYLITRVLEDDLAAGTFSFWKFYERRMRRIFPALFVLTLACTLAAGLLFPTQRLLDFGHSLLAVIGFVSNVYFRRHSPPDGYFADASGDQLLLHTWTLSLEEQFYLLFPIGLLLLHKFARNRKRSVLLLAVLLSFAYSVHKLRRDPIAAFYLLPGRAWELLIGALLSLKPLPALKNALLRTITGLLGLAAIVYAIATFHAGLPFPGVNALYPCLGACLLIYSGEPSTEPSTEGGPSLIKRLLGLRPLVLIGAISYSLYLWHWPAIVLAKFISTRYYQTPQSFTIPLLIALALSFLSFECIETPFRKRRPSPQQPAAPRRAVSIGLAASAAMAALSLVIILGHGLPNRFPAWKRTILDANYAEKKEFADIGSCANFQTNPQKFADVRFCEVGHTSKNILVWGDSHVSQLYPLLSSMQQQDQLHGKGLVFAVSGGCSPAENINMTRPGFHCDAFAHFAHMRAAQDDIDTVYIQFLPWWVWYPGTLCMTTNGLCTSLVPKDDAARLEIEQLSRTILDLKQHGKRVILGLPFPYYDKLIPDFEIRNAAIGRFARSTQPPIELSTIIDVRSQLQAMAAQDGIETYDPRQPLCPANTCIYARDNISLYSDQSHLAISQLGILRPSLLHTLSPPSATPATASSGTP